MRDLNKIMLIGRLGGDPEMRYTPSGGPVTSFRLATSRPGRNSEETDWHSVVAWDKLGELCNQYLTKGSRVYIEGRVQTRSWQDQSGQSRSRVEIIASDMIMLDGREGGRSSRAPEDDESRPHSTAERGYQANDEAAPPARRRPAPPPPDLSDDDIPF